MIYQFDEFELDLGKAELRSRGLTVHIEPQVYALLALLIQNRDRLVSKDEIIDKVWGGRFISESAVSSRVKSLRQSLGDNGTEQRVIKTIHARGFRFVADVEIRKTTNVDGHPSKKSGLPPDGRPSIAILPFAVLGDPGPFAAIGQALPHELIAELSRMRWLSIIARGSSFQFQSDIENAESIARVLAVRYCLTGTIEFSGQRLSAMVHLTDSNSSRVIWADRFHGRIDDIHNIRESIRTRIVTALEISIPAYEAQTARLGVSENLDAWSAYHLGLQHMYRFNRQDNAQAESLFQVAVSKDPAFARAYAGLSFVHFQTAFLRNTEDLASEADLARRFAEQAMEHDPLDPFVNFVMGRSFWLKGDLDNSLGWLERSTHISPNYAQGIYACAWTEALSGDGLKSRKNVDLAMRLSPLDPLYYAMLGTRSLSHMTDGDFEEAAVWADKAARSPGAHVLIAMIAVVTHALAGLDKEAIQWTNDVRSRNAALTSEDFFRSFPVKSEDIRARASAAFKAQGFN